jgi:DNA-binding beta-propeller fold protein YncE
MNATGKAAVLVSVLMLGHAPAAVAQSGNNPYRLMYGWEHMPGGRAMGIVSGVYPTPDGEHLWILERCGANNCAGSDLDPIHLFDLDGNVIRSLGAGLFAWPHGFDVDDEGNFWVTEGAPAGDERGEPGFGLGMGHQVIKLSPSGDVLMRLGEAGVPGDDESHFNGPSAVHVAPNGEIWVADGHRNGNNRIVKFAPDGTFLFAIGGGVGTESKEAARFDDPHDIKMDSQGRVFVADRGNNRIQIFSEDGELLSIWTQFGKPSGLFIDADDTLYVSDGLSGVERPGWRDNFGWERGIRIGSARTGWVEHFILDSQVENGSGIEFLAADHGGNIYAGEVGNQRLAVYVRTR